LSEIKTSEIKTDVFSPNGPLWCVAFRKDQPAFQQEHPDPINARNAKVVARCTILTSTRIKTEVFAAFSLLYPDCPFQRKVGEENGGNQEILYTKMDKNELYENAYEAAEFLKTIGNQWRLMVLCSLGTSEKSVGTLEQELELKQSALSQHLARLRRDGLVKTRREAQTIYYSIADNNVMTLIEVLQGIFCPPDPEPQQD
jgi:DNA-binding transcriptional ArsR family regulator